MHDREFASRQRHQGAVRIQRALGLIEQGRPRRNPELGRRQPQQPPIHRPCSHIEHGRLHRTIANHHEVCQRHEAERCRRGGVGSEVRDSKVDAAEPGPLARSYR
jgi:hypothetical protein